MSLLINFMHAFWIKVFTSLKEILLYRPQTFTHYILYCRNSKNSMILCYSEHSHILLGEVPSPVVNVIHAPATVRQTTGLWRENQSHGWRHQLTSTSAAYLSWICWSDYCAWDLALQTWLFLMNYRYAVKIWNKSGKEREGKNQYTDKVRSMLSILSKRFLFLLLFHVRPKTRVP